MSWVGGEKGRGMQGGGEPGIESGDHQPQLRLSTTLVLYRLGWCVLDDDRDDRLINIASKGKASGSDRLRRSLSESCIVEFYEIDPMNETPEREKQTNGENFEK